MRTSLAFALALLLRLPALAQKEYGFDNRKPSGQPYLKPEETVARFKVPDGFEVKLFAGEPPGRQPRRLDRRRERPRLGRRVLRLSQSEPGRMPRAIASSSSKTPTATASATSDTVFAEGKDFPVPETEEGRLALRPGHRPRSRQRRRVCRRRSLSLVHREQERQAGQVRDAAQRFWQPGHARNAEHLPVGSGRPALRSARRLHPFRREAAQRRPRRRGINAAVWRYHPKTKKFEIFAEGTSNPWGMDWRNTDGQFILCCCVIPHLFHIVPGGIYKRQAGQASTPMPTARSTKSATTPSTRNAAGPTPD